MTPTHLEALYKYVNECQFLLDESDRASARLRDDEATIRLQAVLFRSMGGIFLQMVALSEQTIKNVTTVSIKQRGHEMVKMQLLDGDKGDSITLDELKKYIFRARAYYLDAIANIKTKEIEEAKMSEAA